MFKGGFMVWWVVVIFIVALAIGLSAGGPQQPSPSVQEIEAPTAEEGRAIPVLFGTRDIKGPNVVWYGDVKTVAVKKKGGKK